MKHFTKLLLSLFVMAGVALGASDRRAEKLAEMKAEQLERTGLPASIQSIASGWVQIYPDAAANDFRTVQYFAPGIVWIAGFSTATSVDYLWRSYDNAASWTRLTPPTNKAGGVFAARDSNLVLGATFTGELIRSTNGGVKWDTTFAYGAGAGFFDGITFIGKDTVVAIGDADASGLLAIRSTNAGATWTRLTNLPAEEMTADKWFAYATYRKAVVAYKSPVWAALYTGAGTDGRILKSTDAGVTWASWPVPLTGGSTNNYRFRSICFVDDSTGFGVDNQIASGSANWLHKTTNGGTTWSDTISVQPGAPHNDARLKTLTSISGTDIVVATGFSATTDKVFLSTDKGTTWTAAVPPGTDLVGSGFLSATKGFAVGLNNVLQFTSKNVHKVTFNLNTATIPDTIPVAGSSIQVRGGTSNTGGFSPITWGNDAQNNLTRFGGDYWKKTVYMQAGDTLRYKYAIEYGTATGWEQGCYAADFPAVADSNANRSLIVPDKDTTLSVEFWNNGAKTRPQYFRPWTAAPDSFLNVYFRVNLRGKYAIGGFDPVKDTVAVRGGGNAGADLNWDHSTYLTAESAPSNGGGYTIAPSDMYSARLRFPKSSLTEGASIEYKFLFNNSWDGRQEASNRSFAVPVGKKDTTLYWVFYDNIHPLARPNPDTIKITFNANMAQASASGGVDVVNDTVYVRTGTFTTAAESGRRKRLVRGLGTMMSVTDTIITAKKKVLDYQYYVVRNGVEIRENYYNFFYTGTVQSEAERRQVIVDSTASLTNGQTVRDTATSVTQARRQPLFPNGRKLARNVNVTWRCDLRPAYYQVNPAWGNDTLTDVSGAFTIIPANKDSIMKWGVWINGLAVGGWGNPGTTDWDLGLQNNLNKKMYDNGTNGDAVAGDSIFSRKVLASPDSISAGSKAFVGQVYKFGIRGGDNEGGKGGYGNNHNENIVDTDTIYTITTDFGSINPAFYDAWDYDLHKPKKTTSVFEAGKPLAYELAQNYPNPFNPTTKIEYSIPALSKVELRIYNVVGQEVATLVNEVQQAGLHHVKFDGMNLASGMYFYRLTAGDFVSVKKMVLLK